MDQMSVIVQGAAHGSFRAALGVAPCLCSCRLTTRIVSLEIPPPPPPRIVSSVLI